MPIEIRPCTCGHSVEEHGHNPKYPGSTACTECDCIAYEPADDDEAEPPKPDKEMRKPVVVGGVTFHCFRLGPMRYEWRSEDQRISIINLRSRMTYRAYVDGKYMTPYFRTEQGAMRSAVKQAMANRDG